VLFRSNYGNIGLRHTAALGMAERSDALCIVVSEERGTISLAHHDELLEVKNAAALHEALEKFYMRNAPAGKSSPIVTWLKENTREKVIAIILSAILWLTFGYQREVVRRDIIVPIEYTKVPPNWRIDEPRVTEAKIFIKGPAQAFQLLDERSLKLSLDLSPITGKKREFSLDKDMVNTPSSLSVTEIAPDKIRVYASKLFSHTFPLNIVTQNSLPKDLSLQKISASQSSIRLLIDSRMNPDQIRIETEPIDLQKISKTTYIDTKIILPAGVSFTEGKSPVARVTIKIKKK
jgi:hypothetical protein